MAVKISALRGWRRGRRATPQTSPELPNDDPIFGESEMLREFLVTIRDLSQAGADLNKFYDTIGQIIKFEHDEEKIDKMFERVKASTEKLSKAES